MLCSFLSQLIRCGSLFLGSSDQTSIRPACAGHNLESRLAGRRERVAQSLPRSLKTSPNNGLTHCPKSPQQIAVIVAALLPQLIQNLRELARYGDPRLGLALVP